MAARRGKRGRGASGGATPGSASEHPLSTWHAQGMLASDDSFDSGNASDFDDELDFHANGRSSTPTHNARARPRRAGGRRRRSRSQRRPGSAGTTSVSPPWRQPGQAVQRPRYSELLSWSWPTYAQGQDVVEVTLQVCLTNVAGGVQPG